MAALSESSPAAREFFIGSVNTLGNSFERLIIEADKHGVDLQERLGPAEVYIGDKPFGAVFNKERDGSMTVRVRPARSKSGQSFVIVFPNVTELSLEEDSLTIFSLRINEVKSLDLNFLSREIRFSHHYLDESAK